MAHEKYFFHCLVTVNGNAPKLSTNRGEGPLKWWMTSLRPSEKCNFQTRHAAGTRLVS